MIILLVFAFVFACIAAHGISTPRNWGWSFGWASLACYFLSLILPALFGFAGHPLR
jgi:hypothetical protein